MTYYFYILQCIDGYNYYGHTNNLIRRILEHSRGEIKSTRKRRPVKLVYFEELQSRKEAFKREMQFKNGKTRKQTISKLIDEFPKKMSRVKFADADRQVKDGRYNLRRSCRAP